MACRHAEAQNDHLHIRSEDVGRIALGLPNQGFKGDESIRQASAATVARAAEPARIKQQFAQLNP